MGLLETRKEGLELTIGYLGMSRKTPGDSLTLNHSNLVLPQLAFTQPGVFGANLYYLRESGAYQQVNGDSVENRADLFGLDLAAGPASGLFRVGFGVHASLGSLEYAGDAKRVLLSVPSLRFDLGSRPHPALELGLFAEAGGRFDSLQTPKGHLDRVASLTLPRYGLLADVGGTEEMPVIGNIVLELGTERMFGEHRVMGDSGIQYPTIWTGYWTFQTQWLYPFVVQDFHLQPALRLAHRSGKTEAYAGLKGNQNPFKKGLKLDSLDATQSITAFGLGAQVGFRDLASLLLEWETAGHAYSSDSTREERYSRFSLGVEHHVHRLPIDFPESVTLSVRAGWSWRQDAESQPGHRGFHFDPFLPADKPMGRPKTVDPRPDAAAGYRAFSLGFSLGLLEDRLGLDGFLGLPTQPEPTGARSREASGTEFGLTTSYRFL